MLRSNKIEVIRSEVREVRAMQKIFLSFLTDTRFFGNKKRRKRETICLSVILKKKRIMLSHDWSHGHAPLNMWRTKISNQILHEVEIRRFYFHTKSGNFMLRAPLIMWQYNFPFMSMRWVMNMDLLLRVKYQLKRDMNFDMHGRVRRAMHWN
jgi:hypothetical protein